MKTLTGSPLPPLHCPEPVGSEPPLVVYSHLRWGPTLERPQHLMSRIARYRRVVFIEEPARGNRDTWELARPARNLLVARPLTTVGVAGFAAEQRPALRPLLERLLRWSGIGPHTAWLTTPLAWPLAAECFPETVVYDCTDELSSLSGAPAELRRRERELLDDADLVFTGGPSLHRAKGVLHGRVRCVPRGVDARSWDATVESMLREVSRVEPSRSVPRLLSILSPPLDPAVS